MDNSCLDAAKGQQGQKLSSRTENMIKTSGTAFENEEMNFLIWILVAIHQPSLQPRYSFVIHA